MSDGDRRTPPLPPLASAPLGSRPTESPIDARTRRIHSQVDRKGSGLIARNRARLHCKVGCAACCVDGITVFELEADRIRVMHPELLRAGQPHLAGACALLDETGACRVYADRPYVCRTQGLPLRWIDRGPDGVGEAEYRDICPLNELALEPIEALARTDCWSIGPVEEALRALQASLDGGAERRVALRDLFAEGGLPIP